MPASYPTAVKSFTTKNTGDSIQASHINDLQDEVAAIEAGLIAGASPLQSSNSTLANLTVLGGSTLASLQVAGNSTIAGTLTVTTIISTSVAASAVTSAARVTASGPSQFNNASTHTRLALDTKEYDLSTEWDSTTYSFTPKSSGYYAITGRFRVPNVGIGAIFLTLWVNDSAVAQGGDLEGAGQVNGCPFLSWTGHLSSGAPVNLRAYAASTARSDSGVYTSAEFIKLF